ncbi:hypothetical protein CANARDRAFT_235151 [[Candida] arabinofermentans NRRL YB-2248]|uniref:precorrin-2 dehydrogenase n=1 Tax=[Candida] arabinofermentans NRRL YB-2248 TaxID=983967 RepID=A0A1E4SYY3_9ASCO|nr:hypothetical protein CANARDRAFT_235151 [[Candida] arabinofermentans NRRL YB-2248]
MDNLEIPKPNGSLMLAWQVKNRHVLVVGGGDVALSRVNHLLQANAKITIIAKEIHPIIRKYNELGLIYAIHERGFQITDLKMYESSNKLPELPNDLSLDTVLDDDLINQLEEYHQNQRFAMVLTCLNDYQLSLKIYHIAKLQNLNINLADKPSQCDFYFGSTYRKGPLQIMISSNGQSPRFCNRLKEVKLKPVFESLDIENAVSNLGYLRGKLRKDIHPGEDVSVIKERMEWNKTITDRFSIEDWCLFKKSDVDLILKTYPNFPNIGVLLKQRDDE